MKVFNWISVLRFFTKTAVGWTSTEHGSARVSELQMQTDGQSTNRLTFPRFPRECGIWLTALQNTAIRMSAWNPRARTGYPCSTFLRRPAGSHWYTQSTQNCRKEQSWTQGCRMDLWPIYVQYDQVQFYPATQYPPTSWPDALSHKTHLYACRWKGPRPELSHHFQSQAGWCVLWHVRQLFAFHQSIHFGSSWRAVRCDSISWPALYALRWRSTGCCGRVSTPRAGYRAQEICL